jgi:anaerobic selenocysteine-containing dehydrogenase
MKPNRREFLWTIGAAATTVGLGWQARAVFADNDFADPGWAPGIEEHINSACLICPGRCGIRGRVVDGRLVSIAGSSLHPVNQGGICPRGIGGVQVLYHPDRVRVPMVRTGARGSGEWREIAIDEAIAQLGDRLTTLRAEGRPQALAALTGYAAGTMDDVWRQFLSAFGSPNLVRDAYDDGTAAVMHAMHGISQPPGYDLERADFILSFGAPLFEAWWSPLQAFAAYAHREVGRNGQPRFIQVDTRFSRTAARAHDWYGIRPGSHAALALGIAYVLIRDELYDTTFVDNNVAGFDDTIDRQGRRRPGYRSRIMRHYRTEDVSAATGVPVARVTALARAFADSAAPVAVLGSDVLHDPDGMLAGLAVHSLNVLMGRINRPGGVVFGDPPPLASLPRIAPDPTTRAGLASDAVLPAAGPMGNGDPAMRLANAVAAADPSPIDTLLLYYANPLASSARPDTWQRALERIPFVVSFSPFLDDTTAQADLIIPDLLPYERWQDAPSPSSYPHPVWALAHPIVEVPPTTRQTGDVLLTLSSMLGDPMAGALPYEDFESLLRARAEGLFRAQRGTLFGDAFERAHHRAMEERGWWLPEHGEFRSFWNDLVTRGGWTDLFHDETDPAGVARTASRRIELLPPAAAEALRTVGLTREPYTDVGLGAAEHGDEFPLRLIPYRVSTLASGTLGLQPWIAEQPALHDVHWVPWVEVAPETAEHTHVGDGQAVWIVSEQGRFRARLKISHGIAHETVASPYGPRHPDGTGANPYTLLDGRVDPLTGLPSWSTTFVRLEPA